MRKPNEQPLDRPEVADPYEDPVCHNHVDPKKGYKSLYRGRVFYFDSKQCKSEFDRNPQLWISVSHAEMSSANYGVI